MSTIFKELRQHYLVYVNLKNAGDKSVPGKGSLTSAGPENSI